MLEFCVGVAFGALLAAAWAVWTLSKWGGHEGHLGKVVAIGWIAPVLAYRADLVVVAIIASLLWTIGVMMAYQEQK